MEQENFNQEIEEALLGTILSNNMYLLKSPDLEAKHFYFDDYQKIFEEAIKRIGAGEVVDFRIISTFVKNNGIDTKIIKNLSNATSGLVDMESYSNEIIRLWQIRELKKILTSIISDKTSDFNAIKTKLEGDIADISINMSNQPKKIDKVIDDVLSNHQKELIFTGFDKLDTLTGGFELGNLVIIGGRPSSGKTTFCLNFAKNVSLSHGVLFFSMEVSDKSLARKFLNETTGASAYRLKIGATTEADKLSIENNRHTWKDYNLILDQENGINLLTIRSKIKRAMLKNDIKMICIDYLQLIASSGKEFSREQQISRIAEGLKKIAKDFNIVVVALSQLSRAGDSRENKRPILSDLRDSGAIEQNADIVMFTHREEYFLEREKVPEHSKHYEDWLKCYNNVKGKADIIVSKNREGECGDILFNFNGKQSKFWEANDSY
jgi:replicative DNA helicase